VPDAALFTELSSARLCVVLVVVLIVFVSLNDSFDLRRILLHLLDQSVYLSDLPLYCARRGSWLLEAASACSCTETHFRRGVTNLTSLGLTKFKLSLTPDRKRLFAFRVVQLFTAGLSSHACNLGEDSVCGVNWHELGRGFRCARDLKLFFQFWWNRHPMDDLTTPKLFARLLH